MHSKNNQSPSCSTTDSNLYRKISEENRDSSRINILVSGCNINSNIGYGNYIDQSKVFIEVADTKIR